MQVAWVQPSVAPPSVMIKPDPWTPALVSWFLMDVDRPFPWDRSETPFLHFGRLNVPTCQKGADLGGRRDFVDYLPPEAKPDVQHCFQILVAGHEAPVSPEEPERRAVWDSSGFLERNGMRILHQQILMPSEE